MSHDCFTINSIFYSTNTRPLPDSSRSIPYSTAKYVKKYRVGSPTIADLPDRPRPLMPDQYPTWSDLIELI
ncbi:hypothetical protein DPMN_073690 [Dreissena polymorpha]|uniref:Uncharacterized protein n=1 Tax=Dreissena polymorpha TaxID=45954 RepID=A0A9D4BZJ3_DREPO|nr:hypothetical protein DPMN_073690 [Dreissena polymorpha]